MKRAHEREKWKEKVRCLYVIYGNARAHTVLNSIHFSLIFTRYMCLLWDPQSLSRRNIQWMVLVIPGMLCSSPFSRVLQSLYSHIYNHLYLPTLTLYSPNQTTLYIIYLYIHWQSENVDYTLGLDSLFKCDRDWYSKIFLAQKKRSILCGWNFHLF